MIDLIWIKRISDEEDEWLKQNLINLDKRYNVIVVGHTNLDPLFYNFNYIPFFENGMDSLGLICHKKNLGIRFSKRKYCLVLHSDMTPSSTFYDLSLQKNIDNNTAVAPYSVCKDFRAFSWCEYPGKHKDINQTADLNTYIAGGSIFAQRELFLKFPWDENLRHNMEEDVELSRRMFENNVKLICIPDLVLEARRSS